jgi:hypothetical protein
MSGLIFLSENYTDTADFSLTTGTENAQFPLENLRNDSPSVKFRSIGSTAVILMDLGMTRDIDYIAIAAVSVKTSTTTDFSLSTSYPITLSVSQTTGYVQMTEVSHRYVQLTLVGSGGFAELGKVFVGKGIELEFNSLSIDSFNYNSVDRSEVSQNKYGQKFVNVLNKQKEISGSIQYCTKAEQEIVDDVLARHGQSYPLWIIVDKNSDGMNDGANKLSIYGYNEDDIKWSAVGGQHYNISLSIKQAI